MNPLMIAALLYRMGPMALRGLSSVAGLAGRGGMLGNIGRGATALEGSMGNLGSMASQRLFNPAMLGATDEAMGFAKTMGDAPFLNQQIARNPMVNQLAGQMYSKLPSDSSSYLGPIADMTIGANMFGNDYGPPPPPPGMGTGMGLTQMNMPMQRASYGMNNGNAVPDAAMRAAKLGSQKADISTLPMGQPSSEDIAMYLQMQGNIGRR